MSPERVAVLPLLVVAVALVRVAPIVPFAALLLVATVASAGLAGRFTVTRNEQALLGVGALSVGILLPRALAPDVGAAGTLPEGMYALGAAAQLAALVRAFLRAPVGGAPATCAIGLVALTAAGRASVPFGYPAFVALYLVTSAIAIARADEGRPAIRRLGARHAFGAAVVAVVAMVAVFGADTYLPPLQAALMKRIMRGFGDRTGFTEQLALGDMRGMTQSSEVVLRTRGAGVDHLRGVVFRRYNRGYWESVDEKSRRLLELEAPVPVGPDVAELELINRNVVPLPLGAKDLWSSTSVLEVDPQGVLHPVAQHKAKRIAFRAPPGGRGAAPGDVADRPEPVDSSVPQRIREPLAAVLRRWGAEGRPPREVANVIEARLRSDYTYSLEFTRDRNLDPVVDFLERQRRGHCEYFATAAALLARTAGIPARVVGGYVVTERSDLGRYGIVRERDAHAWVEVYLDGGWETLDATPGPVGAVPTTPLARSLVDYLQTAWERVDDWLAERSQLELSAALVALLVGFVAIRVWRNRVRVVTAVVVHEPPLEAFADLSRALVRAGVTARLDAEPVESYARRVAAAPLTPEAARAAAGAIADYAALRYGADRSEPAVVQAMQAARALVDAGRASGAGAAGRPSAPR